MLVAHSFEENSLSDVVRHELRWARTIFSVDPLGYVASVTHALPLALIGAALRGFDAWGLAAILGALTCRLFLKCRLAREFKLPPPGYEFLFARDMLSFAI
jgi:ceramide glucosyltransferase